MKLDYPDPIFVKKDIEKIGWHILSDVLLAWEYLPVALGMIAVSMPMSELIIERRQQDDYLILGDRRAPYGRITVRLTMTIAITLSANSIQSVVWSWLTQNWVWLWGIPAFWAATVLILINYHHRMVQKVKNARQGERVVKI